ncbi:MAG: 6-phosphofructokinase [Bdellovibrionales bacterium]|nr:6-phosphofructokinase [Bdellovibrionales bacterium]
MKRIAIVVSGGPAPGINAVIGASAIEATNRGIEVLGIHGGLKGAITDGAAAFLPLDIDNVSRIYNQGGSLLGTSRFNPLSAKDSEEKFLGLMKEQRIEGLIMIGGEGSATLSSMLSKRIPGLRIAHVPKTIDNDIPLPSGEKTFGFETARTVGTQVIDTLVVDAKTCHRWYLVETMGRQAGFLTIGMSLASGASLSLIPEEYQDRLYDPIEFAERIVTSIKLRYHMGKNYGVALLAEGLLDRLRPESSELLDENLRDELGRLTYSEVELGHVILPLIRERLHDQGIHDIEIKHKNVGYELRCARPIGADIEYARVLGYGAVESLSTREGSYMITRDVERLHFIPLETFVADGRVRGRTVDLDSDVYKLACRYMVR